MNSRTKLAHLFITFFVALAGVLTSCQDPKDIGLELLDEQIGVHLTDTATVEASVVLLDSVKTLNPVDLLAGQYNDDLFGVVKTQPFFQLIKPGNAIKTNFDGAVCDSVVMLLEYAYAYGDTLSDQKIEVHELTEELKDSTDYYNSDQLMFDPASLGDVTFKGKNVDFGDTVKIKLDKAFGDKILNLSEADLTDQNAFKKAIKGLTITYGGMGDAVAGFRRNSIIASVTIYFKKPDNTQSSAVFILGSAFNRIVSDRAGKPVAGLINTNDKLSTEDPLLADRCFLEGGVGIRTILKFPYLESLKVKIGNSAINKAEIILESVDPFDPFIPPPPALIMFESDGNDKILKNDNFDVPIPNELALSNFYLLEDNSKFTIPLTNYLKALFKGTKTNNGVILSATDNSIRLNRFVFGAPKHPFKPLKLRIYYTPIQ